VWDGKEKCLEGGGGGLVRKKEIGLDCEKERNNVGSVRVGGLSCGATEENNLRRENMTERGRGSRIWDNIPRSEGRGWLCKYVCKEKGVGESRGRVKWERSGVRATP